MVKKYYATKNYRDTIIEHQSQLKKKYIQANQNYKQSIIPHYQNIKSNFITHLETTKGEAATESFTNMMNEAYQQIEQKDLVGLSSKMLQQIGRAFLDEQKIGGKYTQARANFQNQAKEYIQQGEKKQAEIFLEGSKWYNSQELTQYMYQHLSSVITINGGGDYSAIIGLLKGTVKRAVMQTIMNSKTFTHLKRNAYSVAGLLREGLYYEAIADYFNSTDVLVQQVGAANTIDDIKIVFPTEEKTIVKSKTINNTFTIQAKSFKTLSSWPTQKSIAPWTFKISNNAELYNNFINSTDVPTWENGVLFLSNLNNFIQALGNHVFFTTGSGLAWTADLIMEFRKQNYYLAFMSGKSSIGWQTKDNRSGKEYYARLNNLTN